ncbi:MAG: hypothetical protein MJ168_03175 [Clostridia bacterium]|nr:hypothetical protein [Clostridia bacterium]
MFKKFCIAFISVTLCVIIGLASFVYVIDPFNVYRADKDMTQIIYQMPYYQNIGIAKYTKYDTLITGTSMTQNFRGTWFNEKFGCNAIRLSFDGGVVTDFEALLKTATENNKELKTVFLGLDNYVITADSKLNDINERIPVYELDDNPFTKIKYLLNKDIIFNYIPTYFSYKNYPEYNFYEMHAWDTNDNNFSKERVLNGYTVEDKKEMLPADRFKANCDTVINSIGKIIKDNSDVQFIIFAPPYSILYWHELIQLGTFDATFYALNYVYAELLKNENVRMFYFQNDFEKITNLNGYKDKSHYCTDYNRYMLDCFADGKMEITAENCKSVLGEMKTFAEKYDYDSLLKG